MKFKNAQLEFEAGQLQTPDGFELAFFGPINGFGVNRSTYRGGVWDRVATHEPDVIGAQLLYPQSEPATSEDKILGLRTLAARAWSLLPGSIEAVNGRSSIDVVFGDHVFGDIPSNTRLGRIARGAVPAVLAVGGNLAWNERHARSEPGRILKDVWWSRVDEAAREYQEEVDALAAVEVGDTRDLEIDVDVRRSMLESAIRRYNKQAADPPAISRRGFLKSALYAAAYGGFVYPSAVDLASFFAERSGDTEWQGLLQGAADRAPFINYELSHMQIRGGLALTSLKAVEVASDVRGAFPASAVVLAGDDALQGAEVTRSVEAAQQGVRDFASYGFARLVESGHVPSERLAAKITDDLAAVDVVRVGELDPELYDRFPIGALRETILEHDHFRSRLVDEALEDWQPPEVKN